MKNIVEPPAKGAMLYEGKAKIIYSTSDPALCIQYFKDDATAFNGKKKGSIPGKGECNNAISSRIFSLMEQDEIPTHFVDKLSEREMLVKKVDIIPIEVVMRNVTAGSLAKRMGVKEGAALNEPVLEFYYKDDSLGDPMINKSHARAFGLADDDEISLIESYTGRINNWLTAFFDGIGITLVDYKLEFGRSAHGIILADEISPDGCRLWDKTSGKTLDKDRFRRDMGELTETYEEIKRRVMTSGDMVK